MTWIVMLDLTAVLLSWFLVHCSPITASIARIDVEGGKAIDMPETPYKLMISSPNLTLTQRSAVLCSAFTPSQPIYITRIDARPIPGVEYHMSVNVCSGPGVMQSQVGSSDRVWDCSWDQAHDRTAALPHGPMCAPSSHYFHYQYQGGPVDEAALRLPSGTGIPVGKDSVQGTIVIMYHFFKAHQLRNGSTLGSAFELTVVRQSSVRETKGVSSLLLLPSGFVGAKSVGTVTASWTLKQETVMRLLTFYTHYHQSKRLIGVSTWIERKDSGVRDVIPRRDPRRFVGVIAVDQMPTAVLRPGDRISISCMFNNSDDRNLRVGGNMEEDCGSLINYTIDDGGQRLPHDEIFVVDPFYEKCFTYYRDPAFYWTDFLFAGESSFHGATSKDCESEF